MHQDLGYCMTDGELCVQRLGKGEGGVRVNSASCGDQEGAASAMLCLLTIAFLDGFRVV